MQNEIEARKLVDYLDFGNSILMSSMVVRVLVDLCLGGKDTVDRRVSEVSADVPVRTADGFCRQIHMGNALVTLARSSINCTAKPKIRKCDFATM